MQMILSTTKDHSRDWMGGTLISLVMARKLPCLLRGIVLVVGAILIPVSTLSAGERSHPSLVDPAITKCTVCHTSLGATHTGVPSSEGCLTCHTFVKRSEKTYLVVEESRQPAGTNDLQEPEESGVGGIKRQDDDIAVPPDTGAARSEAPSVETIAVIAGEKTTPSGTDLPSTSPSAGQESLIVSDDSASTWKLYAEGMAAFDSADFDRAFGTWWQMLSSRPDHWAVQVELDTYLVSAQSTLARYREHSLYVVKKDDFHWVLSGLFATRAEAIEALRSLPAPLRKGGAFPIEVREIMSRP